MKNLTVMKALDNLNDSCYGKRIKFSNASGSWWDNYDRVVESVKITKTSVIFTLA
jgi:hypothetical protein